MFKRLNWYGFWVVLGIVCVGLSANPNVSSFMEWLVLWIGFGLPLASGVLWIGRSK